MKTEKKLLIYKLLIFAFAFLVAFMPSTVSRSKEVNSRVIVEILGIDGGDTVSLTAQYVMPTETQGSTSKDTVTVEGKTLTEAVDALSTALGRRAELGHCSMVIVGKSTSPELLGTLMTATDVTADVYLSAAKDKASELVGDLTSFMKKTGATDADFIAYGAQKAHIATNTLLGFLSDLGSASESAYIPLVEMLEPEQDSSGGESGGGSGGGEEQSGGKDGAAQGGDKKPSSGMNVEKLVLYNRSGRAGILDRPSARGVAWVSAPIEKGVVTADVEYDGKTVENVSGRLIRKYAYVNVDAARSKATVKIKAFIQPNGDKFNELDAENNFAADRAVRRGFTEKIKSEIESAYNDSYAVNCDPLFIGRQFYRYEPDFFEELYAPQNVKVEFAVDVILK